MYTSMKNRVLILMAALIVAGGFSACKKDDKADNPQTPDGEYAVIYTVGDSDYLLNINSLTEGTIGIKGNGVNVTNIFTWGENIIQKGRTFYHLDPNEGKFGKYVFENDLLTTVKEVPFNSFPSPYLGWHVWLDDDQVMFGPRSSNIYAIVNTATMTLVKSGDFGTTGVPADHSRQIFSVIPRGNKLLIGYGLYNEATKVSLDKSYLGVVDFPSLTNFTVSSEDERSAPIGALRNGYFSQFTDKGDTFVLTHPIALGANKPNMPTGFFRIKEGSTTIDPGYFFNVSAITNNDKQLGVCDLGNGKVILINAHDAENKVKEWNDWWYADMWEYLVVDVTTQQVIKKLDLPPLLNSRSAVVHDGKAYIAVNDPTADAIYIYEYDPIADTLKKGLKVEGGSDNTPILFKLN